MKSKSINVSINESYSLLRRSFEAISAKRWDFDDSAQLVLWLETHGLDGFMTLVSALPVIEASAQPTVAYDNENNCTIDVRGGSLFVSANVATDMAIAMTVLSSHCHMQLSDCRQPVVILPCVARCGRRGLAAAAWWIDDEGDGLNFASTGAGDSVPHYASQISHSGQLPRQHSVELLCAANDELLTKELAIRLGYGMTISDATGVSDNALQSQFEKSVMTGMTIDREHYQRLSALAERLLVEASEESRRGAGE